MPRSDFGERLKTIFGNATNREIASLLGVSPPAVQNYVDGRVPPAETLMKIAAVTNCDLHWLLTGKESPTKTEIVEKKIFDPLIDRSAMQAMIREIVREELLQADVQDLGSVDGFDLAEAVERLDDPQAIMNEWYRADGLAAPADYGIVFFRGWKAFSREEKIAALRDARRVLDRAK